MSRKKYEFIDKIKNFNNRTVTYHKRIKGLLKKAMELSVLCDQDVFVHVHDKNKKRMLHYASDVELDFTALFDQELGRAFVNNNHYQHVGGEKQPDWGEKTKIDLEVRQKFLKEQWGEKKKVKLGNQKSQTDKIPEVIALW